MTESFFKSFSIPRFKLPSFVASIGNKIVIRLADGSEKPAEVVIIDTDQDLALLRIRTTATLPALVVQLGYTNLFETEHHWQTQAEYELEQGQVCGFRPSRRSRTPWVTATAMHAQNAMGGWQYHMAAAAAVISNVPVRSPLVSVRQAP